jgi:hypothetical protein
VINRSKRISPLFACLALTTLVAGCGEKEEPATTGAVVTTQSTTGSTTTGPGDQGLEPRALASLFLTGKPQGSIDLCAEGLTPAFLREAYGGRPGCLASRKPAALATTVSYVSAAGNDTRAIITAEPKGGTYDGDKLVITIVKDGTWQIDDLRSNAPVGP